MFLVFIVGFVFNFCLIEANNENYTYGAETKYVNSLTDQSKKTFIQNVANRISKDVKEYPNTGGEEGKLVPDSELEKQNAFVANLLREEADNMRRRNGEIDLSVKTTANSTDDKVTIGEGNQNDSASIEIEILQDKSGKNKIQEKDIKIPVTVVYEDKNKNESKIDVVFVKPKSKNDTVETDTGIVPRVNDSNNVSTIAPNLNIADAVVSTILKQSDLSNGSINKDENITEKEQLTGSPVITKENILNGTRRSAVEPSLLEPKAGDIIAENDSIKLHSTAELKEVPGSATKTNEATSKSNVVAQEIERPSLDVPKKEEVVATHAESEKTDGVRSETKETAKPEVLNHEKSNDYTATTLKLHEIAQQTERPSIDVPKHGEIVATHVESEKTDGFRSETKETAKPEVLNREKINDYMATTLKLHDIAQQTERPSIDLLKHGEIVATHVESEKIDGVRSETIETVKPEVLNHKKTDDYMATTLKLHEIIQQTEQPSIDIPKHGEIVATHVESEKLDGVRTETKETVRPEVLSHEEKASNIQVTEKMPIVSPENKIELSTAAPVVSIDSGVIATSLSAVPYIVSSDKTSLPESLVKQTSHEPPKTLDEKVVLKTVDLKPGKLNLESTGYTDKQEIEIKSSTVARKIEAGQDKIYTDTSSVKNIEKKEEITVASSIPTTEEAKSITNEAPIVRNEEMIKPTLAASTTKMIENITIAASSTLLNEQTQEAVSVTNSNSNNEGGISNTIISSTIAVVQKEEPKPLNRTKSDEKNTIPVSTITTIQKEKEVSVTDLASTKSSNTATVIVTDKEKETPQITLKPDTDDIEVRTEKTKENKDDQTTTTAINESSNITDKIINTQRYEATTESIISSIPKPEIKFKTREDKTNKTKKSKKRKDKASIKEVNIEYQVKTNSSSNKDANTNNSSALVFKVKNSQIHWPRSTKKAAKTTTKVYPTSKHTVYEMKTKHIIWPETPKSGKNKLGTTEEIIKAVTSFITGYPNSKESGATESQQYLEKLKNSNYTQPPEFEESIEEEKAGAHKPEIQQKSKGTMQEKLHKNEEIKKVAVKLGYKLTEVAPKNKKKEYNIYEIPEGHNPFEKISKGGNVKEKSEHDINFFANFFQKQKRAPKKPLLNLSSVKTVSDENDLKVWKEIKKVTVYDYDLPQKAKTNKKANPQKKKKKDRYQSLLSGIKKTIAQKISNQKPNYASILKNVVNGKTNYKVTDQPAQDDINKFLLLVFGSKNNKTLRQKKEKKKKEKNKEPENLIPGSNEEEGAYNMFLNAVTPGMDMVDFDNIVLHKLNMFGDFIYKEKKVVGILNVTTEDPFYEKERQERLKKKKEEEQERLNDPNYGFINVTEEQMVNGTLQNVTVRVSSTEKPNVLFAKYIFREGYNKTYINPKLDIRLVPMLHVKLPKKGTKNSDVNDFVNLLKKLELNKRKGRDIVKNDHDFIIIPNNRYTGNEYPEMKTKVIADDYYFGDQDRSERKEKLFNDFDDIEIKKPSKTPTGTRKMESNGLYDAYALKKLGWEHNDSLEKIKRPARSKRNKKEKLDKLDKPDYKDRSDGSASEKLVLRSRLDREEASGSIEYNQKGTNMFWNPESNRDNIMSQRLEKEEVEAPALRKRPRGQFMSSSDEDTQRFARESQTLAPVTLTPKATTKYNAFARLLQNDDRMLDQFMVDPRDPTPKREEHLNALRNKKNLDGFLALNRGSFTPRSGGDVNIDVYVNVLTDMLGNDNRVLEKYDWLGTTVDIRSALNKLFNLCEGMRNNGNIHPKDFHLLKYMQYLYRAAKEELSVFQPTEDLLSKQNSQFENEDASNHGKDKVEREIKQKPKKPVRLTLSGKRHRVLNLGETWIQREGALMGLDEFENFFRGIERVLNNLHDAIKHIALITEFKSQRWYKNLKELYLQDASRKQILELILHLEFSKIIEMIESSSNKINNNYVKFAMKNKDLVEETKNEFVLLMEIYNQLKKYK